MTRPSHRYLLAAAPAASTGAPSRPLRVLVVGVSWPLETFVERLLTGLAGQGIELTLAPLWSFARPPKKWTEDHRIRWADDAVRRSPRAVARSAVRRDAGQLAAVLRPSRLLHGNARGAAGLLEAGWDVVYAPWINALTDHPELLTGSAPLVTSCRGTLVTIAPWDPSRTGHRDALASVFDAAHLVHCVSEAIITDAVAMGLDPTKARVIRPAVDPEDFQPRAETEERSPVRVVSVGGLTWTKDYEHALLAIRKAIDAGADLRLDLIGDGPDRQHLQFAVDDLALTDRVRLLGRQSPGEVAAHLRDADVFLHTSSSEGISNAVLEAMATGLPIVTTEAGGMREAVRDGVDGFVIRVRDADATAAALAQLADGPAIRARLGAAARQRVLDDFRLDQQVAEFAALLHEAAGR